MGACGFGFRAVSRKCRKSVAKIGHDRDTFATRKTADYVIIRMSSLTKALNAGDGGKGKVMGDTVTQAENVGQMHGAWGEDVAVEFLRRRGFEIIDRNSRPVKDDERLEIDVVAWDRASDTMVFVEVKQHARISPYARRLRSIDRRKRQNLRRACGSWRRVNRWLGAYRFDVVEVYGAPGGGRPVVDHIRNVELFPPRGRFVKWN